MAPPREAQKPTTTTEKVQNRLSNENRSVYFARREAAKVLRTVLRGDARKRAVGSIKTLVYVPSVRNKKATFALVCQTLKYLRVIKEVLDAAGVLNSRWKRQEELVFVVTYDILLGKAQKDDTVADLLILPPGTDLHVHPLVIDGSVFLQGKGSSMVAAALEPQPGWLVIMGPFNESQMKG